MGAIATSNWYPSLSALVMAANALRTATFMNVSAASYVFLKYLAKDLLNFPSAPHPSVGRGEMAMFAPCCPSLAAKSGHYDVVQLSR